MESPPSKRQRTTAAGDGDCTDAQCRALEALRSGRNVFVTGPAGTGKTHLVRHAVKHLDLPSDTIFVTATTGIAALHIGGTTVHSFAGIRDPRGDVPSWLRSLRLDPEALRRWQRARLLIIDEVSMLSAALTDKLDDLARRVRAVPDRPFGGIQLLLTGDFFQLPPVPERNKSGERPQMAFQSLTWRLLELVPVVLDRVFRQADPSFAALLAEVRVGVCSPTTVETLRSRVGVQPPPGVVPTQLRATVREVDAANERAFQALPGVARAFRAVDDGPDHAERAALARACPAPDMLWLKVGAAVVLLRNVDPTRGLVNGAQGVIVEFSAGGLSGWPCVRLTRTGQVHPIVPAEWMVFAGDSLRARRRQLPLRLAYALTIHRAQGMEMDAIDFTTDGVFEYGQAYVALSRARTLDGVFLRAFEPYRIRTHPAVRMFHCELTIQQPQQQQSDEEAS